MKLLRITLLGLFALLCIVSSVAAQDAQTPEEICAAAVPADNPATRQFTQAEQVLQPDVDYRAILCTGVGAIYVDLFEDETPITVNNFVFLAQSGYYNNITFHRVIENFMAQGGDPDGTGMGGPGYQFVNEPVPYLNFDAPGMLAMANAGQDTNGSQFFITTAAYPSLNQSYTLFGRVVNGQANVESIRLRDPQTDPEPGTTLDTVVIITDPTTVALPEAAAPVTQEEVKTAIDQISTIVTPEISSVIETVTSEQTVQEVIDSISDANRETIGGLLEDGGLQYRVQGALNNKACDLETVFFISASYVLDAYPSADAAGTALASGVYQQLGADKGFGEAIESANLPEPYFSQTITACDRSATHVITSWQRGQFVATAEFIFPADDAETSAVADRALRDFVGANLFEPFLSEVLYRDIR
jgi:cyclophilin family peptidyl-prolyl cis-trans isomerase